MIAENHVGRVVGLLLLTVFALGVLTFQFLQTSVLSGPGFVGDVADDSPLIVASAFVGIMSGFLSVWVAVLLFPVFRRASEELARAYVAFAVVNFVAIIIDTVSVLSVLEFSRLAAEGGDMTASVTNGLAALVYGRQWWTHHIYLLISCIPVLLFYSGLYMSRSVPRLLALFGIVATAAMATEMIGVMLGSGISDMLFIPVALVQVITPIWLLICGIR